MAIQINDRDQLIFKLLDEHEVLLEKHISWFISTDNKPVLIRDRLRKLFYLDYVLCQRHRDTLPWWTTPTKPLVYCLSQIARDMVNSESDAVDVTDTARHRHLLEIANLRMLLICDEREGRISNLEWTTLGQKKPSSGLDARATFNHNGVVRTVGIINQPVTDVDIVSSRIHAALATENVDMVWIVSRDEESQEMIQSMLVSRFGAQGLQGLVAFATHQELYKAGIARSRWQNAEGRQSSVFVQNIEEAMTRSGAQACTA